MPDNVLETIQKLVQDVIAPDVRELKARVDGLEHRMDDRFKSLEQRMDDRFKSVEQRMDDRFAIVDQKFAAMDQKFEQKFAAMDQKFAAMDQKLDSIDQKFEQKFVSMDQKLEFQIGKVLSAIAALRTEGELAAVRDISALRERVAVLEMQQKSSDRAA